MRGWAPESESDTNWDSMYDKKEHHIYLVLAKLSFISGQSYG